MIQTRNTSALALRSGNLYSTSLTSTSATVITPLSNQRVFVVNALFSNASANDCISIGLRFGGSGTVRYSTYLHSAGGGVFMNFIQCELNEGSNGDALYVIMDTTNSPTVLVTVEYYVVASL